MKLDVTDQDVEIMFKEIKNNYESQMQDNVLDMSRLREQRA